MDIGIGLPSTIPHVTGGDIVGWARRAEERGFSSLGTIDRIVYPNLEPLTALAAAAAVTERPRLMTDILLAPLHGSAALLAKQASSIDVLSGGRMVLGMAPGGRPDDYEAVGVDFNRRGQHFDAMLDEMIRIWGGEKRGFAGAVGPASPRGRPELLFGGNSPAAVRRTVQYGDGWTAGGGGAQWFAGTAERVRQAWTEAGRDGKPRLVALAYFALGPQAEEQRDRYLHHYYEFLAEWVDAIVGGTLTTEDQLRAEVAAFADAGCDELIPFPCSSEVDQVDRLADAVL
jgi:alkanesulfonate monooxygenase SsuD/methylene tetrahydromethanopterin reductase-like flavin-dependent oxidoreductase (luciferase family)